MLGNDAADSLEGSAADVPFAVAGAAPVADDIAETVRGANGK